MPARFINLAGITNKGIAMQLNFDPNDISKFSKLEGMSVKTATSSDDFVKNVKYNVRKKYKGIQSLPGFAKIKGHNNPIALIGGGYSIKKELDRIKDFAAAGFPILACGSVHDYLLDNNVIPTYSTICDPDPLSIHYLKRQDDRVKYLLALSIDPRIFEHLKGKDIYVWNCKSDEAAERIKNDIQGEGYMEIMGGLS